MMMNTLSDPYINTNRLDEHYLTQRLFSTGGHVYVYYLNYLYYTDNVTNHLNGQYNINDVITLIPRKLISTEEKENDDDEINTIQHFKLSSPDRRMPIISISKKLFISQCVLFTMESSMANYGSISNTRVYFANGEQIDYHNSVFGLAREVILERKRIRQEEAEKVRVRRSATEAQLAAETLFECPVCLESKHGVDKFTCGHIMCSECYSKLNRKCCSLCRSTQFLL